ncbi:hypothetical protein [Lacrimispora sp.]|uniref:hypothetical protein n=1 Tax=Lacrimispora sp. TaxID=2719234 RepID=UPI002FD97AB2
MIVHQVFAQIYNEEIKNIIVCNDYEMANWLTRASYGDEAFAVDCLQYPCGIGDKYCDGIFYRIGEDGKETIINYVPTAEEQVKIVDSQISHLSKITGIGVEAGITIQPTLEELKEVKRVEVNAACGQNICNGITVELSTGFEHFSLSQTDQLNLLGLQAQIALGVTQIIYHADGQPCCFYPASDITLLIEKAMFHASYHTTYANSLRAWIDGAEMNSELETIYYGADVPEEYQSEVLKAYLAQITAITDGTE